MAAVSTHPGQDRENNLSVEDEEELNEEQGEELFFKLLPDELLTEYKSTQENSSSRSSSDPGSSAKSSCDWLTHETLRYSLPQKCESHKLNPRITNVVSAVNLGCMLDVYYIATHARNVQHNYRMFNQIYMRIRNPRSTAVIFNTGKLVCFGAGSVDQSRIAARKFARIVQKLGYPVHFLDFRIHNISATCKTFPIHLEQMVKFIHCSYEPELFNGLFYHVMPGICLIIFGNGRISLTGAREEDEVYRAFEIAESALNWFWGCCRKEVCGE